MITTLSSSFYCYENSVGRNQISLIEFTVDIWKFLFLHVYLRHLTMIIIIWCRNLYAFAYLYWLVQKIASWYQNILYSLTILYMKFYFAYFGIFTLLWFMIFFNFRAYFWFHKLLRHFLPEKSSKNYFTK